MNLHEIKSKSDEILLEKIKGFEKWVFRTIID